MSKYSNGKIYKLMNKNTEEMIYIGSTILPLEVRLYVHKTAINHQNSKLYKYMREIGGENIKIELIENYSCKNKEELEKREGCNSSFIYYLLLP